MFLNSSENEKLFAKLVPVSLKDVYTNQSRSSHLFLTMEWQEATSGMYNRKVLSISLTDNDDPFFLHNLHLSEEDFQTLKTNQDLLINFSSFPQHIIDYIDNCLREDRNPQPKFLLVFTSNEKLGNVGSSSQLDIIETNQFKHLTHLSLKFIAATESAVKQYILSCFRHMKEENRQLHNNSSFMEQDFKAKLAACQQALNGKAEELELVKKELKAELTMKDSKHQIELQEERDRLNNRFKDERDRLEKEIKEKECSFRREIQKLESKVTVLDTLNKDLQDKNFKDDSTIRDLKSKVLSLEDEVRHLNKNLQSYKLKYDQLNSEKNDMLSQMQEQDKVVNDLQRELRSKEQSILKLKDKIESSIEQKKSVEKEMEKLKFQVEMSENSEKLLKNEHEELNNMVCRLQEKQKELTKEEKDKSQLASKYKKMVEEKDKALLDIKNEIADLKIDLRSKNADLKALAESNHSLQRKLDDYAKAIKDKENVIKWLNRQLTENCIVPQYIPPSHLTTSPSSLAQKQLAKLNSPVPENFSPVITGKNAATKSVRIAAASPVCKENTSTPSHLHRKSGTDSAYHTASLHSNQSTPEFLGGNHNGNFDTPNFEIDPEALSAAFGNEGHTLKHSTAKKPTKPVKSTTPKFSKKR